MGRKEEQDQIDKADRAQYKAIRAFIDKNPGITIEKACEEFNIIWPRYYTIRKKALAYEAKKSAEVKKAKKKEDTKKVRKQKTAPEEVQAADTQRQKPSMTTFSYEADRQETAVTPELVPFAVNANDLVFVTVTRAKNIGAIMDQLLHRL